MSYTLLAPLLLLLLSSFLVVTFGRPQFEPFHGFAPLRPSSVGSQYIQDLVHTHSFYHKDTEGREVNFNYRAILSQKDTIVFLDESSEVEAVACSGSKIMIVFSDKVDHEKFGVNTILTGGHEWGCKGEDNKPVIILRRISQILTVNAGKKLLVIDTVSVSYDEVFHTVDVEFATNKFPQDHFVETTLKPEHRPTHIDTVTTMKRGWLSSITSFIGRVWESSKYLATQVASVIKNPKFYQFIKTGDFQGSSSTTWSLLNWNYNLATGSAAKTFTDDSGLVECTNCYAHIDVTFALALKINSYNLSLFRATATGSAGYSIEAVAKIRATYDASWSKTVATLSSPPIIIAIAGVPIILETEVPIVFGYDMHVEVGFNLTMKAALRASIQYGLEYTPAKGIEWIYDNEFSRNESTPSITPRLTLVAGLMVYINPVVVINVQYIGGPNFGIRPFLEITATTESEECAKKLQFVLNWGFQLTVGAKMEIKLGSQVIYSAAYDPRVVYARKWNMKTECKPLPYFRSSGHLPLLSLPPTKPVTGTTWAGEEIIKTRSLCNTTSNIIVSKTSTSYQILGWNPEKQSGWFIGSGTTHLSNGEYKSHCFSQSVFEAKTRQVFLPNNKQYTMISFQVTEKRPELNYLQHSSCDNPKMEYYFEGGEYILSDDWDRLTLPDEDCWTGVITRIL